MVSDAVVVVVVAVVGSIFFLCTFCYYYLGPAFVAYLFLATLTKKIQVFPLLLLSLANSVSVF